MVTFKKEELNFLNTFVSCIDTKKQGGDLFNIKSQDGKVYFSQIGSDVLAFYAVEKQFEEDINYWLNTQFIYNLVSTLEEEEEITFSADGVKMSSGQYEAEMYAFDNPTLESMIEYSSSQEFKEVTICDLKKLSQVKQFVGIDNPGLDAIGVMSGYFTGSDETHTGIVMTENDKDVKVFFNMFITNLIAKYKLEEVSVKILEEQSFYSFNFDGVSVFTPIKKYKFHDNFFEFSDKFMHEDKIIVDKEEILKALNRMKLVTIKDNKYRIFLTYNHDSVDVESKDYIAKKAKEIVKADVDENLFDKENKNFVILSNNFLELMIRNIESDKVVIRTVPTQDATKVGVVTITDPDENVFYIHSAYRNTEVA